MADRVYPAAKPNPQPPLAAGEAKSRLHYRHDQAPKPAPAGRRSCRRRSCCLCSAITVAAILLLAAAAGAALYFIYRPHPPIFSVASAGFSTFNVSSSGGALSSSLDLSVTVRNPNRRIAFDYDETSVSASTASGDVGVGEGSFPAYTLGGANTTVMRAALSSGSGEIVGASAASDLRKSGGVLAIDIEMETMAGARIGSVKTKKVRIRVTCSGVVVAVGKDRKGKPAAAAAGNSSCKVEFRFKIWKWVF